MASVIFSVMRRRDDLPAMRWPMAVLFILLTAVAGAASARLGEAVGATYSADLLDALFSRFCVGK